ncbi:MULTISPECIES: GHMP family kinase ATP-binding protein [Streptomyces]|uniref:Kinase n=1 Tax=Streptomyces sp. JL1001 TaxID=3078227 RepID=A0AAU8KGE0_9ACTN|nr:kinase [Streptomyces sp. CB02613]SCD57179.1 threonine kinase [Streptomyces sp. Termitarium-T10T-6]
MRVPEGTLRQPGTEHHGSVNAAVTGVSTAFGTFGELLQGVLPEPDSDFLVTLPIARWARATFHGMPGKDELEVHPPHKRKALRLAEMIVRSSTAPMGGVLTVESDLPEGKGLASSSADLVATARAVANALGEPMPPRRIETLLARIEPTDGVLYPGIVAFYHRRVALHSRLGALPPMSVVGVDEGGEIDTVAFNRIPKPFSATDREEYSRLLARMTKAVARADLAEVGAVTTRSALMNQVLRPKRMLSSLIDICGQVGGLGVVVGHSGTSLGVLLDKADPAYSQRLVDAAGACSELAGNVAVYRTLSFDR